MNMPTLIVQETIRRKRTRLSSSPPPGKPGQPVQGGGVHSESAATGTASLSFQRFTRWKTLNLSPVLALLPQRCRMILASCCWRSNDLTQITPRTTTPGNVPTPWVRFEDCGPEARSNTVRLNPNWKQESREAVGRF